MSTAPRSSTCSCQRSPALSGCAWSDSRWSVIDAELAKGDHGGFDMPTLFGALAVVLVAALATGWLL